MIKVFGSYSKTQRNRLTVIGFNHHSNGRIAGNYFRYKRFINEFEMNFYCINLGDI